MTVPYEFSRPIAVESIVPSRERTENLEASVAECAALAKRFDLKSLSGLKGKLRVDRVSEGNFIKVEGDFEADAVQICVVSLQDVPSHVKAHFETYFTEDGKEFDQDGDFGLEVEDDIHQIMSEGMLDLGELVAQYLALELDPYPRAPGVSLAAQLAEVGGDAKNRPFKVLEGLKPDKKDE
ncbi:MAG: DUF177 domain-containing protein [Alphaproteobacteria bacterium]|nr:DUF177 domain-containing protein [Alphaproteobacteria bacterium]